jgi:tetratricopeptide (TPR) repeat protein
VTLLDVSMDFEVIWASRFEGTTADLFTLQDTIASQTVAQIDPELLQRHQFRGESVQAPNAVAHQAVLTAIQGIYRPDRDRFLKARDLLLHAINVDPDYATAHAWLAYWYIIGLGQGWIDNPSDAGYQAGMAADRAVALDPLDARGITIAGHVKAYLQHDLEASLSLHHRAISLNPNLPIAWTLSSWAHIYNGEHQIAVNDAMMAVSLSPTDPHVFFVEHAAMTAYLFLRDLERADYYAASVLERKPGHASALKVRLAIFGHTGRVAEAQSYIEQLRRIDPLITIERIIARPPLRDGDRAYYAEGLRLAGVPTTPA